MRQPSIVEHFIIRRINFIELCNNLFHFSFPSPQSTRKAGSEEYGLKVWRMMRKGWVYCCHSSEWNKEDECMRICVHRSKITDFQRYFTKFYGLKNKNILKIYKQIFVIKFMDFLWHFLYFLENFHFFLPKVYSKHLACNVISWSTSILTQLRPNLI